MREVYVIGHKNPDTDSVCSAICYSRLKNLITGSEDYIPKRAGHLNEETQYVLEKCGVKPPAYIKDVRPQVRDIDVRKISGISEALSVRNAWKLMKERGVETLPIIEDDKLKGLVTISDVAKSYFEMYDSDILSVSGTSLSNIVDTLKGRRTQHPTRRTDRPARPVRRSRAGYTRRGSPVPCSMPPCTSRVFDRMILLQFAVKVNTTNCGYLYCTLDKKKGRGGTCTSVSAPCGRTGTSRKSSSARRCTARSRYTAIMNWASGTFQRPFLLRWRIFTTPAQTISWAARMKNSGRTTNKYPPAKP